jgi:hypothetical protein
MFPVIGNTINEGKPKRLRRANQIKKMGKPKSQNRANKIRSTTVDMKGFDEMPVR